MDLFVTKKICWARPKAADLSFNSGGAHTFILVALILVIYDSYGAANLSEIFVRLPPRVIYLFISIFDLEGRFIYRFAPHVGWPRVSSPHAAASAVAAHSRRSRTNSWPPRGHLRQKRSRTPQPHPSPHVKTQPGGHEFSRRAARRSLRRRRTPPPHAAQLVAVALEADKSIRSKRSRPRNSTTGEKTSYLSCPLQYFRDDNEKSKSRNRSKTKEKEDATERSRKVIRHRRTRGEDESERSQKSIKTRKTTRKPPTSPTLPQIGSNRVHTQAMQVTENQVVKDESPYANVFIKDAPSEKTMFEPIADQYRPAVAHMHGKHEPAGQRLFQPGQGPS
ncbi:hypothetical protein L596_015501 [Steinernema carpocapsae]|uniref:Uncharacterized protein n=1 Tax=Steinernema carpocapsae TaxID=34508 RepID=A0A4U5NG19_STECR|nr:hypothetical protein L596_015501 [Steinernema carpocapsae]